MLQYRIAHGQFFASLSIIFDESWSKSKYSFTHRFVVADQSHRERGPVSYCPIRSFAIYYRGKKVYIIHRFILVLFIVDLSNRSWKGSFTISSVLLRPKFSRIHILANSDRGIVNNYKIMNGSTITRLYIWRHNQ